MNERSSKLINDLTDKYTPASGKITGFSYFVPLTKAEERIGIGTVITLLQFVTLFLLVYGFGSINWDTEYTNVFALYLTPRQLATLIPGAYVAFQILFFVIIERTRRLRHIGTSLSHEFFYHTVIGVLLFVFAHIFII